MKRSWKVLLVGAILMSLCFIGNVAAQDKKKLASSAKSSRASARAKKPAPRAVKSITDAWREGIDQALASKATFDFVDCPLDDAMKQIAKDHNLAIELDKVAIEDAGYNLELPVTGVGKGRSLRNALDILLGQYGCVCVQWKQSLLVTTKNAITNNPEKYQYYVLYDISDLVEDKPEEFVKVIQRTIRPQSWLDTNGGPASISVVKTRKQIILSIVQTSNGHFEIAEYLKAIRKLVKTK